MKVFALYNLKGGVGKTTSCVNLAYLAAKEGHRVLIWDLDPQCATSFFLEDGLQHTHEVRNLVAAKNRDATHLIRSTKYRNLDLIPGSLHNRHLDRALDELKKSKTHFQKLLKSLRSSYDYLFFDCPPALTLLSENIFRSAHFVLLPMIPSVLSERTYRQVHRFFEQENYDRRKIVPFFTLVDGRKKIHKSTIDLFRSEKRKLLRATIPYSAVVEKMGIEQAPLPQFSPRSNACYSYRNLWQELKWFRKLKPLAS